jgi:hypothetical protein
MVVEQGPDEEKPGTADVAEAGATINRGTPESAAFFLAALQVLEENQSSFARLMKKNGDDRKPETILRNTQRMASGEARVSGEMRVLLTFMMRERDAASPQGPRLRRKKSDKARSPETRRKPRQRMRGQPLYPLPHPLP